MILILDLFYVFEIFEKKARWDIMAIFLGDNKV